MPLKSKRQWKFFAINHPELLHKWQKESPVQYRRLPEKARKRVTRVSLSR